MKKNFILLCSLLASFTLQPTKTGAQTAANGQKMKFFFISYVLKVFPVLSDGKVKGKVLKRGSERANMRLKTD